MFLLCVYLITLPMMCLSIHLEVLASANNWFLIELKQVNLRGGMNCGLLVKQKFGKSKLDSEVWNSIEVH